MAPDLNVEATSLLSPFRAHVDDLHLHLALLRQPGQHLLGPPQG